VSRQCRSAGQFERRRHHQCAGAARVQSLGGAALDEICGDQADAAADVGGEKPFRDQQSSPMRATSARSLAVASSSWKSPLTDSNRRPPPCHSATRREARASAGHRGHQSRARRRKRPKTSDRACPPVPGVVFPQSSLRILLRRRHISGEKTLAQPREVGSGIESEHDLVRFLVAPVSEPAPLAHDAKTALRQHTNRRGVVARGASVKRTGCLQLQELL
jgi:hypothetical protein